MNLLFVTICGFFFASFSTFVTDQVNIFILTNSRLAIPSDALFNRLAAARPGQTLSSMDEQLQAKLTSTAIRKLYLRFGPSTIVDCPFCTPFDPSTYLLYHFPKNVVFPHLFNFGILGLVTSPTLAGFEPSRWRFYVLTMALLIAAGDAYTVVQYQPSIDVNMPSPSGAFWVLAALRPLALCFYDSFVAFLIYASATNRFLLFSTPAKDPETSNRQILDLITRNGIALTSAATKMRATTVARNAVVRDSGLKGTDDKYWQEVVDTLGKQNLQSGVWQEEEVQAAIARAYGNGTIDVERVRKEADAFVKGVTRGLEHGDQV